jgi:hypothetical protein
MQLAVRTVHFIHRVVSLLQKARVAVGGCGEERVGGSTAARKHAYQA